MKLMCDLELDFDQLGSDLDIDFREYFRDGLKDLFQAEDDGLIEWTNTGLRVTEMGRLLLRNLAMRFDAYLESTPNRFSKTI